MVVQTDAGPELSTDEVDRLFHALADATRRDILTRVLAREQSVTALAEQYEMSFAAVQKHVAVLERAALVVKERRGRQQIVHGDVTTVQRSARLLDAYADVWNQRALRIGAILAEDGPERGDTPNTP
ncbi:helix-turn-helix domain-containing protein [Plantibacter sp. VKM Ac-2880]|uniref:ArsR/SmtB family transcription factor n=1 Tax=Plantibacter sp. VKM Ac-2880 TaxID=2783827 RepID=UPI00188F407B|nr:metalloregulator ArsR/SmtB family transcription factor [Plantibacter sp. VKM Ac-2880]MBF4567925.1 helix-turn-helix domain-containing protein [Plantibacter sp. VKM Ac-2880]